MSGEEGNIIVEFQSRESEARKSLKWYGTKKQRPYKINPETWEQILFFSWLAKYFPTVRAVSWSNSLNGLEMKGKTKNLLKSAGLTPGVPDICIAYPSKFYHGCYLEMKRLQGGKPTKEQIEM